LCGFTFYIKHLDGRIIKIDSEKGVIKPGEIKCIRNEGMPIKTGNINGDLFIEFDVLFPESEISKEEKEELSKLLKNRKKKLKTNIKFQKILISKKQKQQIYKKYLILNWKN